MEGVCLVSESSRFHLPLWGLHCTFLLRSSRGASEFAGSRVAPASVIAPGRANLCGGKQAPFRRTWMLLIKLAPTRKSKGLPLAHPELDRNRTPQQCVAMTSHR